MITAQEIIDAVSKGGTEKWRPPSEIKKYNRHLHKEQTLSQKNEEKILAFMGIKQWAVKDLAIELNMNRKTMNGILQRLVDKGELKRTVTHQPYLYFKF